MRKLRVADYWMHADCRNEPRCARGGQRQPKASGWAPEPDTGKEKQSASGNGAPESSPVVSNEREKPAIHGEEITCTQLQIPQILRDEHAGHPERSDSPLLQRWRCGFSWGCVFYDDTTKAEPPRRNEPGDDV